MARAFGSARSPIAWFSLTRSAPLPNIAPRRVCPVLYDRGSWLAFLRSSPAAPGLWSLAPLVVVRSCRAARSCFGLVARARPLATQ
mmetsp:Transcript_41642/g.96555  ORF Transcript_41642/g.96555 Transcript_41642/m.96555 type:complete len:86 (-) Transcript_41642:20-277(-)